MDIPLARGDFRRSVAKSADIILRNRYFEENPALNATPTSLLARPGLRRWLQVGEGPIRGIYSQPGSFDSDLFVASGEVIYRIKPDQTITVIGTLPSSSATSTVSFAATANIGTTQAYLFVAAGTTLMCYAENGFAQASVSGTAANGDVIRIGSVYYQFTNTSVDAGTPVGSSTSPWLVRLGSTPAQSWRYFFTAVSGSGTPGTDYSTALIPNPAVIATSFTGSGVSFRAAAPGTGGDTIVTSTTGVGITWTAFSGGGTPSWFPVPMPEDYGVSWIGYVSSYVVVVPTQGQDINGRFYWIKPGETTVDALDFATAERAPDPITGLVVIGDQFWLPGASTTEVWYFTGNVDAPVQRVQGVVYDRGAWSGTAIQVGSSMVVVDPEGAVFNVTGGMERISRPDIEQRIRNAIQRQAALTNL
jgi:hypothetical protein